MISNIQYCRWIEPRRAKKKKCNAAIEIEALSADDTYGTVKRGERNTFSGSQRASKHLFASHPRQRHHQNSLRILCLRIWRSQFLDCRQIEWRQSRLIYQSYDNDETTIEKQKKKKKKTKHNWNVTIEIYLRVRVFLCLFSLFFSHSFSVFWFNLHIL